ncbi:hypothetical protein [Pseudoxanthomonas sp. USHLN014]|uniref:hypothetical protein n=1 Tax=Pseudoxanthomonas sp. USHLN014 TaxID=3081297 RepID=UPI00301BF509
MDITKRQAKQRLAIERDSELATFFSTTRQAVSRWPEDEPLPEGRQWELMAKRPDLFPEELGAARAGAEGRAA